MYDTKKPITQEECKIRSLQMKMFKNIPSIIIIIMKEKIRKCNLKFIQFLLYIDIFYVFIYVSLSSHTYIYIYMNFEYVYMCMYLGLHVHIFACMFNECMYEQTCLPRKVSIKENYLEHVEIILSYLSIYIYLYIYI